MSLEVHNITENFKKNEFKVWTRLFRSICYYYRRWLIKGLCLNDQLDLRSWRQFWAANGCSFQTSTKTTEIQETISEIQVLFLKDMFWKCDTVSICKRRNGVKCYINQTYTLSLTETLLTLMLWRRRMTRELERISLPGELQVFSRGTRRLPRSWTSSPWVTQEPLAAEAKNTADKVQSAIIKTKQIGLIDC